MLAECGFAFSNPRHAAAACGNLWTNWETAKKAIEADQKGKTPNKRFLFGDFPLLPLGTKLVEYRLSGQRHSPATAFFDPSMVDDPRAALTALLGPVAYCRVANALSEGSKVVNAKVNALSSAQKPPVLPAEQPKPAAAPTRASPRSFPAWAAATPLPRPILRGATPTPGDRTAACDIKA